MDKKKLLIGDSSETLHSALAAKLGDRFIILSCADGMQTLQTACSFRPDVLVLDLMMPKLDGLTVLQTMHQQGLCPRVLALTPFVSDYVLSSVERLQVSYLMSSPCNAAAIAMRVEDLAGQGGFSANVREEGVAAADALRHLGIPAKLHGYEYLRVGIELMQQNMTQSITKELYPAIAARCAATASQVERSVRNAIDAGWKNRDAAVWQKYSFVMTRRPSNGEFIRTLAEALRTNILPTER